MVGVIVAEAAFYAESRMIGRPILAADMEDLVVLDVIGELAADAAERTQAVDLAVRPLRTALRVSSRDAGISAPVGQACTHSPQATQELSPIGSSKSKTIFS